MDWIERWFGISPDGGDGSTEALYVFAAIVVALIIIGRRYFARYAGKWRSFRRP